MANVSVPRPQVSDIEQAGDVGGKSAAKASRDLAASALKGAVPSQPKSPEEELLAAFGPQAEQAGPPAPSPEEELLSAFDAPSDVPTTEQEQAFGGIKNVVQRLKTSFGRDTEAQAQILSKSLGPDANVFVKGDKIFVRKNGEKKAKVFDKEGFDTIGEAVADFISDNLGVATEVGTGIGAELGALGAATGVGLLTAGTGAPLSAAIVASSAAGSSALASSFRDGIAESLGAEFADGEILGNSKESAAFGVAGAGLGKAFRSVKEGVSNLLASRPSRKLFEIEKIYREIGQTVKQLGGAKTSREAGEALARKVGVKREGALFDIQETLSRDVNLVLDEASDAAKKFLPTDKFSVKGPLSQMKAALEKEGLKFDKQGRMIGLKQSGEETVESLGRVSSDVVEELPEKVPFNDIAALPETERIKQIYNTLFELDRSGGMNVKQIANWTRVLQKRSKFDATGDVPESVRKFYRTGQQFLAEERNRSLDTIAKAAKGQPGFEQLDSLKDIYGEAAEKLGPLKALIKEFEKSKTSQQFASKLVRPDDPQRVADLKFLLGEGSDQFKAIRGNWLADMLEKNIDNDGFFKGDRFLNEFRKVGQETLDELMGRADQNKIKAFAQRLREIDVSALKPKQGDANILQSAIRFIAGHDIAIAGAKVQLLTKVFQRRAGTLEWLRDEGLREMAEKATGKQRGIFTKMRNTLSKALTLSKKMVDKNGNEFYVNTPELRQFFKAVSLDAQKQAEESIDGVSTPPLITEALGGVGQALGDLPAQVTEGVAEGLETLR